MAVSETAATGQTAWPLPQDVQTLIGLLGNLMPLLVQIQAQSSGQAPGLWATNFMLQNPMLDHQAAVCLVEDITAQSLQTLSTYLEKNAGQNPAIEVCAPIVAQARICATAHDYAQAFNLIWQAYRAITALRAANPQLAALRSSAAATAAAEATSSAARTQH